VVVLVALIVWLRWGPEKAGSVAGVPSAPSAQEAEPGTDIGRAAELGSQTEEIARTEIDPIEPATLALRGRVGADGGGAPPECSVTLALAGRPLADTRTDTEGRFEFAPPMPEGARLELWPPPGYAIEPNALELDLVPAEELVFRARALPVGRVHGLVVDERDGAPVPYFLLDVGGDRVESDTTGHFVSSEMHPAGHLSIWGQGVSYETPSWDPASDEPVVVPARLALTAYLRVEGASHPLTCLWQAADAPFTPAFSTEGRSSGVRVGPPSLVHFPLVGRDETSSGRLLFYSTSDYLWGYADLRPGTGERPLEVVLQPCGFVLVQYRMSRQPEWYETLSLRLRSGDGECASKSSWPKTQMLFIVTRAGEFHVDAAFDDARPASARVEARLGEVATVTLDVVLPEREEEEEPEEALHPLQGRVTSARGRPCAGDVQLTRLADAEEVLLDVVWSKSGGRWSGRIEGEVAAGDYRVRLDLEIPYPYSGPSVLRVPSDGELELRVDDECALADVFLVPVAAEDGKPLLAIDAELVLDDGRVIAGDEGLSPSMPVLEGHPRRVPFRWRCTALGRQAVTGRFEPDDGEGDVRIPVALPRGWGRFLYVGDEHAEPLSGVRVRLDGVLAGETSTDGYACLSAGVRPERIELEYLDWRLDDGDVEPDGTYDDRTCSMRVYLVPPGR